MKQSSLLGDGKEKANDGAVARPRRPGRPRVVIVSEAEVRELAREYFNLPTPLAELAEPPLLKSKRRLRAQESGAGRRGLAAKWASYEIAKGHVSLHDPVEGEWHDLTWKDSPPWARWEARRRAELYKAGDRHAHDLTSTQMNEIWREQRSDEPVDEGIVEDHPFEEAEEPE